MRNVASCLSFLRSHTSTISRLSSLHLALLPTMLPLGLLILPIRKCCQLRVLHINRAICDDEFPLFFQLFLSFIIC